MTASGIAAALGLLAAPSIGATVADAFTQLGPDAVFGLGCGDRSATKSVEAPARWITGAPRGWRPDSVTIMAEIDGRVVTAVHVANPASGATSEDACRAALVDLAGAQPVTSEWRGADLVMATALTSIAHQPARYRAVYRASRHQCRTMLTIGA